MPFFFFAGKCSVDFSLFEYAFQSSDHAVHHLETYTRPPCKIGAVFLLHNPSTSTDHDQQTTISLDHKNITHIKCNYRAYQLQLLAKVGNKMSYRVVGHSCSADFRKE